MRTFLACLFSALFFSSTLAPSYAAIEKVEAIDGSTYAIVPTVINYVANTASFIRFFNGGLSTATISMTAVNPSTGATVGSVANISVPAHAAKIMDIKTLLGSSYANAGVADGGVYVLYLKSSEPLAGYQHLLFNGNNFLFENHSSCANLLNASTLASNNSLTLLGATTNNLAVGAVNFPSSIVVHNYSTTSATYQLGVYDADSGVSEGEYSLTVPANNSRSLPFFNSANVSGSLQNLVGWQTTLSQLYANVIITDTSGALPQATATVVYNNVGLGGSFNMTTACALNAPVATALTATTTFDGTIAGFGSTQAGTFSVTVVQSGSSSSALEISKSVVEKQAATLTATGTLRIVGGSTITLTGTYDTVTRALTVTGGGFSFVGAVSAANTFIGTYTAPANVRGGFAAFKASATAASRGFCGSFSGHDHDGPVSGNFNFVVAGDGSFRGLAGTPDGPLGIRGTVNGTSLQGYADDGTGLAGTVGTSSTNGTYSGADAQGSWGGAWTGTSCGSF